jgi:RecB family exonuclease
MSLAGVVGSLRRIAGDPATDDVLRRAAAARLARLADARLDPDGAAGADETSNTGNTGNTGSDTRLVPYAEPEQWWGMRAITESATPVRGDGPVELSGSAIDSIGKCALRWFLSREAGGASATSTAIGFGNVLHVLAQQVATGGLEPDVPTLLDHLDRVWTQLRFAAPWVSRRERDEAEAALRRFVEWHRTGKRRLVASEHDFKVTLTVAGDPVVLRGAMDRVEVDADGKVVVVDLKTGKTALTADGVRDHAQLGTYQMAVAHGALGDLVDTPASPGGAELVYLRQQAGQATPDAPKVRRQDRWEPGDAGGGDGGEDGANGEGDGLSTPERQIQHAVHAVRAERFDASANEFCGSCEFRALCPLQAEGLSVLSPAEVVAGERD